MSDSREVTLSRPAVGALEYADSFYVKRERDSGAPDETEIATLVEAMRRIDDADPGLDHDEVTVELDDEHRAVLRRAVSAYLESSIVEDREERALRPLVDRLAVD